MKTINIEHNILAEHISSQEKYHGAIRTAMARYGTVIPGDAADELEHLRQQAYKNIENIKNLL